MSKTVCGADGVPLLFPTIFWSRDTGNKWWWEHTTNWSQCHKRIDALCSYWRGVQTKPNDSCVIPMICSQKANNLGMGIEFNFVYMISGSLLCVWRIDCSSAWQSPRQSMERLLTTMYKAFAKGLGKQPWANFVEDLLTKAVKGMQTHIKSLQKGMAAGRPYWFYGTTAICHVVRYLILTLTQIKEEIQPFSWPHQESWFWEIKGSCRFFSALVTSQKNGKP